MNLKGFSGCKVELIDGKVLKTSSSSSYNARLTKQGEKQKRFSSELGFLSAPKVHKINKDSFLMEYINGEDFVSFLSKSSGKEIKKFANDISSYVFESFSKCENKVIEKSIIQNKIEEIYKKTNFLPLLQFIEIIPKKIEIPVGVSHGDLTLSNIIFQKNKLILIDFLDGFIETPLIDIAKLRQDTYYKWSLDLYQKSYDKNKVNISLDYLDELLNIKFSTIPSYKNFYLYFQFLNFARILPYAKELKKINYLRDNLSDIIIKL